MDKLAWIWLQTALGYCHSAVNKVAEGLASPEELMGASQKALESLQLFTPRQVMALSVTKTDAAKRIQEECCRHGYEIITPQEEAYGQRLKNIPLMPAVLYVDGNLKNFDHLPAIGMVGNRNMTEYGSRAAYQLSCDLASSGFVVVSGLAEGIDAQSHKGAIKGDGYTVAVIGCGLDVDYPRSNHALREIIREQGAVVSEYPPGTQPIPRNFPVRNRIISGFSDGVLVVEGSEHSGSMITAGHALAQNRDVFAVPNSIYEAHASGCFKLLRQGAKMVCEAEDVINEYESRFGDKIVKASLLKKEENGRISPIYNKETEKPKGEKEKNRKKSMPDYLTEEQKMIYALLIEKSSNTQEICHRTGMPIFQVLSCLTELEIYGVVKAYPGNLFALC